MLSSYFDRNPFHCFAAVIFRRLPVESRAALFAALCLIAASVPNAAGVILSPDDTFNRRAISGSHPFVS
jgi:hypothetical protein